VQSGWLRASHRKLDAKRSTNISPVHTDLEADARPLPSGKYTKVRVELFPFGQPFRAGSRIRLTVDAPGGARPLWAFDTIAHGERVTIATDKQHRSRLVLPVVTGVKVPAVAPPCRSLRSQPCRVFRG
jgi:predicted acyl esterase